MNSEKLFSQRFWILSVSVGSVSNGSDVTVVTNYHSISELPRWKRDVLFTFRNAIVVNGWCISHCHHLTFLTEDFHSVFLETGRREVNVCLFNKELNQNFYSPHGPKEAGRTVPLIREAALPYACRTLTLLKRWATLGEVQNTHATRCQVLKVTSWWCGSNQCAETASCHLRQQRSFK